MDEPFRLWVHDPDALAEETGDRLEERAVDELEANTVKLKGLVPPLRFASGVAQIPDSTVRELQTILESMRDRPNVRLHLVGHADNQPLSPALARRFGDNAGLSRERAGEVAEFFQSSLSLGEHSITYEWAGADQPVASNDSPEGRAQNRRVEVEVWYDEFEEAVGLEDVVVRTDVKRVKVCRVDTVCKLSYLDGHDKRARVQNLIAPLQYGDASLDVTPGFVERVKRTLLNLSDKQNVTVKFVGHTDDAPLDPRAKRIYGDHLGLSKARAWRVALSVRESLDLETTAIDAAGFGSTRPLATNTTQEGQALNRRVEVEFWYDDPLQELPDEPQLCPAAAGEDIVTTVFDPPWGELPLLYMQGGELEIPAGFAELAARTLAQIDGRENARLRFVGYTRNASLDRRTAVVYGDDVGLSAARAKRAMETVAAELGLESQQVEFEGRGFVHSNDVVNSGFVQAETSHVVVQAVYDERSIRDDEGLLADPLRRELDPENPFALNLMRITADGEPIDDPGRSSADVQRCTDVALDSANISFSFDNLRASRRLSVDAQPSRVAILKGTSTLSEPISFLVHANYASFIERSEVRIYAEGSSTRSTPVATLPIVEGGTARWIPLPGQVELAPGELRYVVRAYGADGNFDETEPRSLWLVSLGEHEAVPAEEYSRDQLLAGYGEDTLATHNIRLGSGTVTVKGAGIPADHTVWVAGFQVPVDGEGNFVAEQILPEGAHTVEVAVLDDEGNGEFFLRDLVFEPSDWFYVGIADLTLAHNSTDGPVDLLRGEDSMDLYDTSASGRLAFYANGKFGDKWRLTTSLDTEDAPLDEMFSNFVDKSPDALFRRIDPDYYYPTYGDDSTVADAAPTSGKMYLKVSRDDSHALWGNFDIGYNDNELATVDRGLYGANLRYASAATTDFGERRFAVDGFGAEPGTVPSRQEFRGTGGSLYFLRHQDLLVGSERVRVETRDSASGLVTATKYLRPALDYDIDYLQGTVLLAEPLNSTAADELLVRTGAVSGDEAYLVVRYEYTPGFDDIDAVAVGAQAHYWINDYVKLGVTGNTNELDGIDSQLKAADVTVRMNTDTWFKAQGAGSEGLITSTRRSLDGGFAFTGDDAAFTGAAADGLRTDVSVGMQDVKDSWRGRVTLYGQQLDAGFAAPGLGTLGDTEQYGGTLDLPLTDSWRINAKSDTHSQTQGINVEAHEIDVGYRFADRWEVRTGLRQDNREDESPVAPLTQDTGERTDGIVQVSFDPESTWNAYGFVQDTIEKTDDREDNGRVGVGGAYKISEKMSVEGEVSTGDLGAGGRVGTTYTYSEQTSLYLNYALENERTDNVMRTRRGREGNLVTGMKTRLSNSASVFAEERYRHGQALTGLTHATGVTLTPTQAWNLGVTTDVGTLQNLETGSTIERKAGGLQASYALGPVMFSSGVEYRKDINEQADVELNDRETWLFRTSFKLQTSPSGRWLGKLNHSTSDSSLGQFYDGGFTEASVGYAYRPIENDRLNALVKYTYVYNVPSPDQVTLRNTLAEYVQKSHVASVDVTYDITSRWSIGGKYAHRLGEISLDREELDFFDNRADLYLARTDYRFLDKWELLVEARSLEMTDLGEKRSGGLLAVSRYFGEHLKVGLGYNFTDFSDDLTDLSFDHQGAFLNITGVL